MIDLHRLFETIEVFNGDLVVDRSGLSAIEGMLVARALMFSSVYMHKTVRISELMLAKAVEMLGPVEIDELHRMTDAGLLVHLESKQGYFEETATLIKYRSEIKRNQSELYLYLQEGDKERVPLSNILDTEGKSVEEIISFASRLVVWSIQNPRSSPFQGLDEPFATLKKENISEAGKIVKELQESLGLQLIITTHETELVDYADRVFNFIKVNGRTVVEEFK